MQWFSYTSAAGAGKTPLTAALVGTSGSAATQYTIMAADAGLFIGFEVHPRNATDGFGALYNFQAFTATNINVVRPAGNSCAKADGVGVPSSGNFLDTTTPICSPRSTTWQISYTGIDISNSGTGTPKIFADFGDGAGYVSYNPSLVNNLISKNDTINLTNEVNMLWQVNLNKTYDYSGGSQPSAAPNSICTYNLKATWGRGGTGCAGTGVQTQPFTVWDKETNTQLGQVDVNRDASSLTGVEIGEETRVCQGDGAKVFLRDNSDFNCTPAATAVETPAPNDQPRWVQYVYGSANTVTAPGGSAGNFIIINNVSYTAAQLPIYGPIQYLPSSVLTPSSISQSIQMPSVSGVANQTFTVTQRTWNTCGPLDSNVLDGNGLNPPQGGANNVFSLYSPLGTAPSPIGGPPYFANAAPATRDYIIRIVNKPAPLIPSPNVQCYATGTGGIPFTITGFTANVVKWYNKDPRSGSGPALKLIQSGASTTLALSNYTAANNCISAPINTSQAGGAGAVYSVWATQATTGAVPCESDPVEVVLIIKPNFSATTTYPTVEGAPTGSTSICNNTTPTYTKTTIVNPSYNIPVNKFTNTAQINFDTQYTWSVGGGSARAWLSLLATRQWLVLTQWLLPIPIADVPLR